MDQAFAALFSVSESLIEDFNNPEVNADMDEQGKDKKASNRRREKMFPTKAPKVSGHETDECTTSDKHTEVPRALFTESEIDDILDEVF